MSTALSKIDSSLMSKSVTAPVTAEQAEGAISGADLPIALNLKKWDERKKLGQYLAHEIYGALVVDSVLNREALEVLRTELVKKVTNRNHKVAEMAGRQLISLAKVHAELATMEMKLSEIVQLRGQGIDFDGRAPREPEQPKTQINAEHVFVQIGEPVRKVDDKPAAS